MQAILIHHIHHIHHKGRGTRWGKRREEEKRRRENQGALEINTHNAAPIFETRNKYLNIYRISATKFLVVVTFSIGDGGVL